MSERSIAPTQQAAAPALSPVPGGLLQRQCACGQHTMGGECQSCRMKRGSSRRHANDGDSFVRGSQSLMRIQSPTLQRQPTVGWTGAGSINAGPGSVGKIRRFPLSGLQQGHQTGSGATPTGRAIVLLPDNFDPTQPTQILIFFHGWAPPQGYVESAGTYLDRDVHHVEQQMEASGKQQLIGMLPQGDAKSSFGQTAGKKSFNSDAFTTEILGVLKTTQSWSSVPSVTSVMISGHSGAGELINEQLLASSAPPAGVPPVTASSLPSKVGTLKEVALFDAINGPKELAAVKSWLQKSLGDDLTALNGLSSDQDKLKYLKSSTRFRAYYSHTSNDSYVARHIETRKTIDDWLSSHAAQLGGVGSPVYTALDSNYKVFDVGHADHSAVMSRGNKLQDALSVMPKRREGAGPVQMTAPSQVHETLSSGGHPLDSETRSWAENRFGHDFSHVRIHTGEKAAESARAVQALAYTVGRDVVFGEGQFLPGTSSGRKLLVHELTHVMQQRGVSTPYPGMLKIGPAHDVFEAQAEQRAQQFSTDYAFKATATPTLQRAPDDSPLKRSVCETTSNPPDAKPGDCIYKFPESCPTYENWISTFVNLKTFEARATPTPETRGGHVVGPNVFPVIGSEAPRDAKKDSEKAAPPPTTQTAPGEKFIDHPTDVWVKTCLPSNLRATAYQLPSDCADIAIILRHVWLAAHKRTEIFGKWTIGDSAGGAASSRVREVIRDVSTLNVALMVNPYTDKSGQPVVSFNALQPLLHAGDILVWEHHNKGFDKPRTGGHTLTITRVERDPGGKIESISALQGNEPIFGDPDQGPAADDKAKIIKALKLKDTKANREELGSEPGRRIETNVLKGNDLKDSDPESDKTTQKTWLWGAETILIAAGPPKSAPRPKVQKEAGKPVRRLSDWFPKLKTTTRAAMPGVFEAVLAEARAMIEASETVADNDMRVIGQTTGERVWELAKEDKGLGDTSHFALQSQLRSTLKAFIESPTGGNPYRIQLSFGVIDTAFNLASRGGTDIRFAQTAPPKGELVKLLLTGFDPFDPSGKLAPPQPGAWNPSGAAVLALDNQAIPVSLDKGKKAVAAVEGVVLPVDFNDFRGGLVERILKPVAKDVDAVITASVYSDLPAGAPVRLERYAVGVHSFGGGEPIPAAEKGSLGPAIIESSAPLEQIKAETKQPASKRGSEISEPVIGEEITFQFDRAAEATAASSALIKASTDPAAASQIQQSGLTLVISDHDAIQTIARTTTRDAKGRGLGFEVAGRKFHASLLQGPGGDFLSNEVSFRTLRLLEETKSPKSPVSFHVHTEPGNVIPQESRTKAAAKEKAGAMRKATGILDRLIATLRKLIAVVTRIIVAKRSGKVPGTP